ncbi:hypothetical protein [Paenibacillus glycanilyticus]|uniref:Uncharacterized protein n=1 Tax=Paenibacillus glycanilyticus TaxID=126569 RepID=A0ABQ6GKH5_9BACL|nr:hypothetical protein [Paenibacillus glycanilyticus]GLX69851.1 hypothetical protein MU1_41970 [Paenibacillus glycanilyticus]
MKRPIFILLVISVLLGGCSRNGANDGVVVANMTIMDKGVADDGQYWVMTAYPDKEKQKSVLQFNVGRNLWNQIEVGHKYTLRYAKEIDGTYSLYSIVPITD